MKYRTLCYLLSSLVWGVTGPILPLIIFTRGSPYFWWFSIPWGIVWAVSLVILCCKGGKSLARDERPDLFDN